MFRLLPHQGMDLPSRSLLAVHWGLDPETVFLNHGSFGVDVGVGAREHGSRMLLVQKEPF